MLLFKAHSERESEAPSTRVSLGEKERWGERERSAECIQHTHIHKYVRSITLSCPYTFHGAQKEKLQAAKEAG
jgi:hypothetical protein